MTPAHRLARWAQPGRLVSYSALHRFATCPRSWYGRYVLQIPDPPDAARVRGRLLHGLVAWALAQPDPPQGWAAALAALRAAEPAQHLVPPREDPALVAAARRLRRWVPPGPRVLEPAWLAVFPLTQPPPRGVPLPAWEAALAHQPPDRAAVLAALRRWQLDAVEIRPDCVVTQPTHWWLADWKTGTRPRTGWAVFARRYAPQLALYAAGVTQRWGRRPLQATVIAPTSPPLAVPADAAAQAAAARAATATLAALHTAAQTGPAAFPPRPGPLCRFCPHAQPDAVWPCPAAPLQEVSRHAVVHDHPRA